MSLTLTDEQVTDLEDALRAQVKALDQLKATSALVDEAAGILFDLLLRNPVEAA